MQFVSDAVVEGCTFFQGKLDNGNEVDSGTLYIKQPLDQKSGRAKGSRTVEEKCIDAEVAKRIMHNEFPLKCRVTYERVVTKSKETLVVADCVPIGSAVIPPEKKAA